MKFCGLGFLCFLLLTGCSYLGEPTASWWSNTEIPLANRRHFPREWSAPRPAVPDTTIHRLVRSLLAQRKNDMHLPDTLTSFWIETTLFDTDPMPCWPGLSDTQYGLGYLTCKGPTLADGLLRKLVGSKLLSADDTVFMNHQLLTSTSFRLRPEMLTAYRILSMDTLWAIRQRLQNRKSGRQRSAFKLLAAKYDIDTTSFTRVSYLSLPVFSRDLQTVILDINNCLWLGMLEGSGATLVLHRENRRWVLVQKLERWIS
ncbi:hypothetical protein [Hymenobacter chitinivorans]|uniref:Lipoprotein n=1 Tax=Hymenobacter chitinivorans DSM 11115 TaxID=1121954 RepID=A0A2M9BA27_9BACT|nr:hypothetical protein [Hymenobacter chitinivorans]PJJ54794.1 hypothetical protein CLV45_3140 [Hymenobacter chitinivorans DSM 11115]